MTQFTKELLELDVASDAARITLDMFAHADPADIAVVPAANLNHNVSRHLQYEWWDCRKSTANMLSMNVLDDETVVFERLEGDTTLWHKMPASTRDERNAVVKYLADALVKMFS